MSINQINQSTGTSPPLRSDKPATCLDSSQQADDIDLHDIRMGSCNDACDKILYINHKEEAVVGEWIAWIAYWIRTPQVLGSRPGGYGRCYTEIPTDVEQVEHLLVCVEDLGRIS